MSANSRKVTVSNLPTDMDNDTLLLMLECKRSCPNGGEVNEVVIDSSGTSAIATFWDESVAQRVVGSQINYNGTFMYIERFQTRSPTLHRECKLKRAPFLSSQHSVTATGDDRTDCNNTPDVIHQRTAPVTDVMNDNIPPVQSQPPRPVTKLKPVLAKKIRAFLNDPESSQSAQVLRARPASPKVAERSYVIHRSQRASLLTTPTCHVPFPSKSNVCGNVGEQPKREPRTGAGAAADPSISLPSTAVKARTEFRYETINDKIYGQISDSGNSVAQNSQSDGNAAAAGRKRNRKLRPVLSHKFKIMGAISSGEDSKENVVGSAQKPDKSSGDPQAAAPLKKDPLEREIPVDGIPVERLKLLQKCIANGEVKCPCEIRVDAKRRSVTAVGSSKKAASSEKALLHFLKSECPTPSASIDVGSRSITDKSVGNEVEAEFKTDAKISMDITLNAGAFRLLERFHQDDIRQILQNAGLNRESVQVTFDARRTCLVLVGTAVADGKLAEDRIRQLIKSDIGTDLMIISEPGLTIDDFKDGSEGRTVITHIEVSQKCAIDIRSVIQSASKHPRGSTPVDRTSHQISPQQTSVVVEIGKIPEFQKADVLVNMITGVSLDLSKEGVIAKGFLTAAGQKLQDELKTKWPKEFGRDVAKTSAYGKVRAKKVYHAAVRRYKDNNSFKLMEEMISKCLMMATQDGMSSIAFPTVGCGKLNYDPKRIADSFRKIVEKISPKITMYIIAFDKYTGALFQDRLSSPTSAAAAVSAAVVSSVQDKRKASPPPNSTDRTGIQFHITTMNKAALTDIKRSLKDNILQLAADSVDVLNPVIGKLNSACEQEIKSMSTATGINVEIDKLARSIKLSGNRKNIEQCKEAVNAVLEKQRMLNVSTKYVKQRGSLEDYFSFLASESYVRYPPYWSLDEPDQSVGWCYQQLDSKCELYKEVETVVHSTWKNSTGLGFDALGLKHTQIVIQNISVVENPALFKMYDAKRKIMCQRALTKQYPATNGLNGEAEILTRSPVDGVNILPTSLVDEINEVFLFHGTKPDNVAAITADGLDERLGGDHLLFGRGTYFAESSTKSDQYADLYYLDAKNKAVRTAPGTKLYMYMARVLLGDPFVCSVPQKFRRPPCDGAGCNKEVCNIHTRRHDSVIGTHSSNGRLLHREFVVYEKCLCYHDFLIEYVRQ